MLLGVFPVTLSLPHYCRIADGFAPVEFWTKQGKAQPWTAEIVATLERALELDAIIISQSLYIHALEASPHAAKAIPAHNDCLPGAGFRPSVHMPAILYSVGRYRDAIWLPARIRIDQGYLAMLTPKVFIRLLMST